MIQRTTHSSDCAGGGEGEASTPNTDNSARTGATAGRSTDSVFST
jgi:hypothetical protein